MPRTAIKATTAVADPAPVAVVPDSELADQLPSLKGYKAAADYANQLVGTDIYTERFIRAATERKVKQGTKLPSSVVSGVRGYAKADIRDWMLSLREV